MGEKDRIVYGLDVGTWKTCLAMARTRRDGKFEVLAGGFSNSCGIVKGVIVNLADVADSIRRAANDLESKSKRPVDSVFAGISGSHIRSCTFRGAVPVQGKHSQVTIKDVENAIRAARSIPLPPEQEVIHLLPQEFFLDSRNGIRNPVGLTGSQLDVNLHVITCTGALSQNLINASNETKIEVKRIILQSIASGESVLTPEEKELGTAVVDIGAGTTDIAVYAKNSVCFASVIPVGGEHFTRDLVEGLRISREEAERIKIESGSVLPEQIPAHERVTVRGLGVRGTQDIPLTRICEYLHDRGAELLEIVKAEIARSGINLIGGAVLTGGGSLARGMLDLAELVLDMPVRQGGPRGFDGPADRLAHPAWACAVGLALLAAQRSVLQDFNSNPTTAPSLAARIMRLFD